MRPHRRGSRADIEAEDRRGQQADVGQHRDSGRRRRVMLEQGRTSMRA